MPVQPRQEAHLREMGVDEKEQIRKQTPLARRECAAHCDPLPLTLPLPWFTLPVLRYEELTSAVSTAHTGSGASTKPHRAGGSGHWDDLTYSSNKVWSRHSSFFIHYLCMKSNQYTAFQ